MNEGRRGMGIAVLAALGAASCHDPNAAVDSDIAPPNAAIAATPAAAKLEAEPWKPALLANGPGPSGAGSHRCDYGMVLVEGMYCPHVEQTCLRYLTPHGRYGKYRCAEYAAPRCLSSKRRPMRFCIDRDEHATSEDALPTNRKSFAQAEGICAVEGKRLCTESEWNFACEGPEMRPYPYGFRRDSTACNADRTDILTPGRALKDLRATATEFPACVSPFGVRHMAGNLEEFVAIDDSNPARPAMKGAYWQPSRNDCRARQTVHGRHYSGKETGFRCCAEPKRAD